MKKKTLYLGNFQQSKIFPEGDCLAISHRHASKRLIETFIQAQTFMSGMLEIDMANLKDEDDEDYDEKTLGVEYLVSEWGHEIARYLEECDEDNALEIEEFDFEESAGKDFARAEHLRYSLISLVSFDNSAIDCGIWRWLPPKVKAAGDWEEFEGQKENSYYILSIYGEETKQIRHFILNVDMDYVYYIPHVLGDAAKNGKSELSTLLHELIAGFDRGAAGFSIEEALADPRYTSVLVKIPKATSAIKKAKKLAEAREAEAEIDNEAYSSKPSLRIV